MTSGDDIIHFRADDMESLSACGVNIDTTPYTFASPEAADVTCPTCIAKMPKPEPAQPDPTSGDGADFAAEVARLTALKEGSVEGSEQYAQADAWLDEIQANGLELSARRPDPTRTGPCELKLSFACTGAGYERLDPRDMLAPETSFRTPKTICLPCYEMAADHYVSEVHS